MTNTLARKFVTLTCAALLVIGAATPAFADFYRADRVRAFDTDTWRVWVPAGYRQVLVKGDGDTDLDCFVYDRTALIGSDTDSTDLCMVEFHNPSGRYMTIRVQNLGSVYNQYEIVVR